jgi:hypothetical protein
MTMTPLGFDWAGFLLTRCEARRIAANLRQAAGAAAAGGQPVERIVPRQPRGTGDHCWLETRRAYSNAKNVRRTDKEKCAHQ